MKEIKKYGAKFARGCISGDRLYDAVGLTAAVGVDGQKVKNDFDAIMPWAGMRRCNTEIVDGERVPVAFDGEPGYDNVNKDVFVYVPLFYYHQNEHDTECVVSSDDLAILEGYRIPQKFRRKDGSIRKFCFLPAYTAGLVNGVPASRSGLKPFITNLDGWLELTHSFADVCIESTQDDEIKNILLHVEFCTRDPQCIMAGAVNADHVFLAGACDTVAASSGSIGDNTSGRFPCIYRGIENPWGNQFRFRWDVLVKDARPYVLDDPKNYTGEVNDHYAAVGYKIAGEDGWADAMGFDPSFPSVSLPVDVVRNYGDSSYGCFFWQWSHGTYALIVGGSVDNGRYAGARFCDVTYSPSYAYWDIGAALSPA